MNRCLESALRCCEKEGFPDRTRCKQKVYGRYGALQRRYGRFAKAATVLEKGLSLDEHDPNESLAQLAVPRLKDGVSALGSNARTGELERTNNMERLEILGELGTVYRHMDDFTKAGHAFDLEYKLGTQLVWQAEAEPSNPSRQRMLEEAIQDFKRRIELASSLRQRLSSLPNDYEAQRLSSKTHSWEAIGVVRLVLCYVATGQIEDALKQSERGITLCETMADPTSRAHARFYHGYALWHRGRDKDKVEAKRLFELHGPDKRDRCTPAIAFCKEPSAEYRGYLAFLIDECTVRVDHYDESGYTALDYAIFSGDEKSEDSIIRGLTLVPAEGNESKRSTKEVTLLRRSASITASYYKSIFDQRSVQAAAICSKLTKADTLSS
ncbi:hypothetical protein LTR56_025698 [Elasticomyces elasticus]|nr:hypothetical protein LTR56_025698 [Elasticomyces elasticus]KAK3622369.1 hypothetical protein LTR22_024823 [Elasticomyces elasticus]KAK4901452.1 hypothetical protein LTR49_027248 [Elasticomyces elasticus]KAK5719718.1 hypothetical protein LTS12_027652 [Elasticomyces elasticus]